MNVNRLSHILKGPLHICIDITNRCNLRCLHCFNRSGEDLEGRFDRELTETELLRLADDVREMQPQNLCLCGGEPLLRKHTIISFLRQLRNSWTHPSMVTNGCLLDRETAWSLRQAGLESVQISIDGADAATHERMRGVAGCYDRVLKAFHTAQETGFTALSVAFSPTQFNFQQVSVVIEQFCQRGLTEFRVQPLMKLGRGGLSPEIFLNAPEYRNLVHDLARARLKHPGIKFEWGDPVEHLIRFSRGMDFVPYISIRANGDICLSAYLPLVIGNIRKHTLKEYWEARIWGIWQIPLFRDLASLYVSTSDLSRTDVPFPRVHSGESVCFDLIDDGLLDLSVEEMSRLYWSRVSSCEGNSLLGEEEKDEYQSINELARKLQLNEVYCKVGKRFPTLLPLEVKEKVDSSLHDAMKSVSCTPDPLYMFQHHGYSYEVCSEDALHDIESFLETSVVRYDDNTIILPEDIVYLSPNCDLATLKRLTLRMQVFRYSFHFFAVRDTRRKIVALRFLKAESGLWEEQQPHAVTASLEFLIVRDGKRRAEMTANLFEFMECNLWRSVVVAVPKIHILMMGEHETGKMEFVQLLEEHGFHRECRLEPGRTSLYSKFLF